MTHTSTRKQFFAKLLGVTAAASVFPNLFAKSATSTRSTAAAPVKPRFGVRPDARSVARRADTV